MKRQLATSIPTPRSSSIISSTPLSTQESSIDGVLAPQPRNVSLSEGRMLPPALSASPSSVRSSKYANSSSVQIPFYNTATPDPDAIQGLSDQVYQRAERNQISRATSLLPPAQNSSYSSDHQQHRVAESLNSSYSSQGYSVLDQGVPLVPAASGNLSSVAQPASDNQEASHLNTSSLARPPANSQTRSSYDQNQNDSSTQRMVVVQRSNMAQPFPENQEELVQLRQMAFELCSRLGISITPQVIHQFDASGVHTNREESRSQGQTSASGMQPLQRVSTAAPQGLSQAYYHSNRTDHPTLSHQVSPQTPNDSPSELHANLTSQSEASLLSRQQFQMQPLPPLGLDDNDLDFLVFDPDEMNNFIDENSDWN
jgi:hypothetical protein